jgi:hypothetical protein
MRYLVKTACVRAGGEGEGDVGTRVGPLLLPACLPACVLACVQVVRDLLMERAQFPASKDGSDTQITLPLVFD